MESLNDQQPDEDAAAGMQQQATAELDHAATATSRGGASSAGILLSRSTVPVARKDEVQRLLCQVLAIRCDINAQYAAPVIIMSQEESNVYAVLERHLRRDYLVGAERFWRLVRAELGVDTWRPRVQGAQLKALSGARLPEYEQEFQEVQRVVASLQDCILPESSPDALMQDLRLTITQIQTWWENRNKRPDGGLKRPGTATAAPSYQAASKRRAVVGNLNQDQQLLGLADQHVLNDPAATAAAATAAAAAAAAAAAGYMDVGVDVTGAGMPYDLDQPAVTAALAGGPPAAAAPGDLSSSLLAAAAAAANPLAGLAANPHGLLVLDVGGKRFHTTLSTLLAVQGSLFWQAMLGQGPPGFMQRLAGGELFIDRSGEHFQFILEYLRAFASNDVIFPLPNDAKDIQALAREAYFYQLPGLLHHIQHTAILPQPSTRTFFDMLYLETGFKSLELPASMREMEHAKTVMMQQLNHIVHVRAQEGFTVEEILPGVAHRQDELGNKTEHNLYYNVLLKKVVPLLPQDMAPDPDDEAEEQHGQEQGDEQEQQQQEQQEEEEDGAEDRQQQQQQQQQRRPDEHPGPGVVAVAAAER